MMCMKYIIFLEYGLLWRAFNWQAILKNVIDLFLTLQVLPEFLFTESLKVLVIFGLISYIL